MLCRDWDYTAGRGCETVASVAAGRGVSFSSSSLGLSCAFSSIWVCGQLTGVFSWVAPELRSLLIVEEGEGGGHGWGFKWPMWVEFFIVLGEQWPAQGTRDAMGFFFGHHSPVPLCSLVVQASTTSIPFAELLPQSHPFRVFPYSQPQSFALICSLNPTFQHPALVCSGEHASQAGCAGQGSAHHVQVSPCPAATHWLPCSLPTENDALLSKLSPRWWASLDVETAPHFHVPPGCRPHPTSSPLPFPSSFSCPIWLSRNLSCFFRFWGVSASVQLGSVKIILFLIHLWREWWSPCLPKPLASWSFCLYFILFFLFYFLN